MKTYFIIPIILLAAFIGYYAKVALPDMERVVFERAQKEQAAKDAEDAKRKAAEDNAVKENQRIQAEREAKRLAKEVDARKKQEEQDQLVRDEIAKFEKETRDLNAQTESLMRELDLLRSTRERLNKEVFDVTKQVELAKVSRRTAEIDIQRTYAMIAQRVTDSYMMAIAPPPPPPPK
jgi:membrane protein involved in colicin uptake